MHSRRRKFAMRARTRTGRRDKKGSTGSNGSNGSKGIVLLRFHGFENPETAFENYAFGTIWNPWNFWNPIIRGSRIMAAPSRQIAAPISEIIVTLS